MYQFIITLLVIASATVFGAVPRANPGEFIVKLKLDAKGSPMKFSARSSYEIVKPLVPSMGLYLVKSKSARSWSKAQDEFGHLDNVIYAQPDHFVTLRTTEPKDKDFAKQWSLKNTENRGADISATEAWDIGNGGKDLEGHDIVIAIVDGGMDLTHEDLSANLWKNAEEIPGNGIDDDGNGYIDDVHGWNAFDHSGNVTAERHGTHVAGIAGGVGNNERHIAGINWNVKLMPVMAASGKTSIVLEGYGYVLKQKQLWLESRGKKGANIVVTNSSFGVDGAKCDSGEFAAWNDIYNEMGKAGILSAAATANANVDIDKEGDVPTGCSSQFLITVTNTDKKDMKYPRAGYGRTTIHLGAPGTEIYSTLPNNAAGSLTGTSMATPHVTGAVAFLHSVLSKELYDTVRTNPGTGALQIKALLLENVDPNESLKGKTVTEGRLNLFKAASAASKAK